MITSFVFFFESRIEAFVPELKNFAEARLEEAFGGRFRLSIGSVDGGIMRPFVFNDIRITDRRGKPLFSSLDIAGISTNYRLWDVLSGYKDSSMILALLGGASSIDVKFEARDKGISGFARVEPASEGPRFKGYARFFGKDRVDFSGKINGGSFNVEINLSAGALKAEGAITDDGVLLVNLKVSRLKLWGCDIAGEADLTNRAVKPAADPKASYIEGELAAKKITLDHRPFPDLKASYRISDGILKLSGINFADAFKGSADVVLKKPYRIDARFAVNNVSLQWLMPTLGAKDAASIISGTMNGRFELSGPPKNLKLTATLDIRKGSLLTLDFDSLNATLNGEWPILRIEDSRINRESGYFSLAGEMDLRKIGKNSLFEDIKVTTDDKAITWDGWDSKGLGGVQEVRMKKKITDDFDIDFKKFVTEKKIDESMRDTDEVYLEYKLHPNESLKMMMGQDKNFLGLEHKDKF